MSVYTEHALELLKEKGLRITKPRRLVVELLDQTQTALSAYEIKDRLDASGERVDTVSVYRILECLEEHRLIHRVLSTGKVRKCQLDHEDDCQLHQDDHCHHLLICDKCNRIEEVHCPGTEALVKDVEHHSKFTIHRHNIEFFGICESCQTKG